MVRFNRIRWIVALLAMAVSGLTAHRSFAQAPAGKAQDAGGVYLDEPMPAPPPTIVAETTLTEKSPEGDLRIERQVRKLSNDLIINHGKYTEYYPNGQKFAEGNYIEGVHDGPWNFWYENGQLAKTVTFVKGKANGTWEVHRPDGSLKAKKSYNNNKRDGLWVEYFDDGKTPKVEQPYANHAIDGLRKTYHPNGKVFQQVSFKNGKLHGPMIEWDATGKKVAEANFENGTLNGTVVRWGEEGGSSEQSVRDEKLKPQGAISQDVSAEGPAKNEDLRLLNAPK